jgi:hypothetical protein
VTKIAPRSTSHFPVTTWPKTIVQLRAIQRTNVCPAQAKTRRGVPRASLPASRGVSRGVAKTKFPTRMSVPQSDRQVAQRSRDRVVPMIKRIVTPAQRHDRTSLPRPIKRTRAGISNKSLRAPSQETKNIAPPLHVSRIAPNFAPMVQAQGKKLMTPSACVDFHPFASTLREWETGVPVDCGKAWEWETIEMAVEKGAHRSALTPESISLINDDVAYQVKAGYAEIFTWEELKQLRPKNLKVSPIAVVPQRNRRGRMILDLSFAVRRSRTRGRKRTRDDDILQESVNDSTIRLAPDEPVKELGNVLPRLLDFMMTVPAEEHIHFQKVDLADGYWRMIVEQDSRWNFAYVMPGMPGTPVRLVVPSALQMGWNESPAYFCATTETTRDVAQTWIDEGTHKPTHPMESFTEPENPAKPQASEGPPHQMSSVYVDDFINAAVEDSSGKFLQRVARATLHAIHSIFQPPAETGTPGAKDPISEKKLAQGDARWDTKKEILGYWLDGIDRTIQLPPSRAADLLREIKAVLKKRRIPLKRFRSLVGRLQHAARILPSARAFFTPLNNALRGLPDFIGLSRTGEVRIALLDIACVIRDLASRPTHVSELVQAEEPDYIGYCDASGFGAGGVWFGGKTKLDPIVWRIQWPKDITGALVSDSNPHGTITNSDLEMAGVLLQEAVLEAELGSCMVGKHFVIGSDNSPAVAWTARMASRSASPIAFRLLRGLAMRQRLTRSAPPAVYHVAGVVNTLADVASRPVPGVASHFHLMETSPNTMCPQTFLTIFNAHFPLPQNKPWRNVQPSSALWSNVTSTLRGRRLALPQWMGMHAKHLGTTGPAMPDNAKSTPGCGTSTKLRAKPTSLPLPPGFALASSGERSQLVSSLWKKPSVTWHKPSCWLGTTTPAAPMVPKNSICRSGTS